MTVPTFDLREATRDLADTWAWRQFWTSIGWQDVRRRYYGSMLGSFWIVINLGATIGALTFIFVRPFATDIDLFLPYVAAGIVLWRFIQSTLNEAGYVLISARDTLLSLPIPVGAHFARLLWRNFLSLCHDSAILVVVALAFGHELGAELLLVLPGLALLLAACFLSSLTIGIAGARWRDLPPLVGSAVQLLFFVTPVFWLPSVLPASMHWIVALNPVSAFIDLVRLPYLGQYPPEQSWWLALASLAVLAVLALIMLAHGRQRVALWI